jgi:hypothetical protein
LHSTPDASNRKRRIDIEMVRPRIYIHVLRGAPVMLKGVYSGDSIGWLQGAFGRLLDLGIGVTVCIMIRIDG